MKLYPIFTRRIVLALEKLGFKVVKIAPNRTNPNLNPRYLAAKDYTIKDKKCGLLL